MTQQEVFPWSIVRCDGEGSVIGHGLTGTWIVTVEPPPPGQKFTSLQAYTSDGRVFEDGAPVGRTTAYGSWEHGTGQDYFATTEFLLIDPNGQLAKEHIDRRIKLAPGGDTFTFRAEVHFRDLNDQDTAPLVKVTGSAKRMAIVHIQ